MSEDCELCGYCGRRLLSRSSLNRHIREVHKILCFSRKPTSKGTIICDLCPQTFVSNRNLFRHKARIHKIIVKPCKNKKSNEEQRSSNDSSKNIETMDQINDQFPENSSSNKECTNSNNLRSTHYYNKIVEQFPTNYEYKRRDTLKKHSVAVQFSVLAISEMEQWRLKYEEINRLFFRKSWARKSKNESIIYKMNYRCGHYIPRKGNRKRRRSCQRNTNCPVRLLLCVLKKNDGLLAIVRITGQHNHIIGCADSIKFRPVSEAVKKKLLFLFSHGYTPAKALRVHIDDLRVEYGNDFHKIQGDRFYLPSIKWVYHLHRSAFKKDFGARYKVNCTDTKSAAGETLADDQSITTVYPDFDEPSSPATLSLEEKMEAIRDIDRICNDLKEKISANANIIPAAQAMLRSYEKIQTDAALVSALACFGKYEGYTSSKVNHEANTASVSEKSQKCDID